MNKIIKNHILVFLSVIMLCFSCSEDNVDLTNEQNSSSPERFFLDEVAVDSVTIYGDTSLAPYVIADEVTTTHAFTDSVKEVEWLSTQSFGEEVIESLKIAYELRVYAEKNGVISKYEATGTIPEDFQLLMESKLPNYKNTEGLGVFYKDVFSGDKKVATTYSALTGGWKDAITSARDVSTGFHFYKKWFFRSRGYTWIPASTGFTLNFAGTSMNDATRSTFNF